MANCKSWQLSGEEKSCCKAKGAIFKKGKPQIGEKKKAWPISERKKLYIPGLILVNYTEPYDRIIVTT